MSVPTRRQLGATGLSVTRIGLGLAALGRPAYINLGRDVGDDRSSAGLELRTHQVLDAAYAAGIRYVDAARSYGRAEEFLGSWLRTRGHPDVTAGSKWGYRYVGEWRLDVDVHEVKDHSLPALEDQYAESRRLLGDFLHLYQVHSATFDSGILDDRAVLARLAELAGMGLVMGLSVSGPRQSDVIRAALRVDVDERNPFSCVQATWNPLEQSAAPALQEASEAGWGVIVKEALANGRLVSEPGSELRRLSRSHGATADAVALAVALAQPWADVVLSGAGSVAHLRSNLNALDLMPAAADLEQILSAPEPSDRYWQTRSELSWH